MKKLILLAILVVSVVNINAQLKVDSIGRIHLNNKVAVGAGTDFSVNADLQQYGSFLLGTHYGFYSKMYTPTSCSFSRAIVSICGMITHSGNVIPFKGNTEANANSFLTGVAGIAQTGVGVYGAIGTTLPVNISGNYAGYFNGNLKTTGTMTASSYITSSDKRLKNDISEITSKISSLLYNLRPVSYKFSGNDTIHFNYDSDAQELKNTHYGLIAQEVKELYPNLVYENPFDGYLSINYTELIPLLISTIQEQNERILALEGQARSAEMRKLMPSDNNSLSAKLYQNNPNPFNQSTVISYDLPHETQQAVIYIYDMTGTQIDAVNITDFGSGSITLTAGKLQAGMYHYSLIADGKIIDTKQMILTK